MYEGGEKQIMIKMDYNYDIAISFADEDKDAAVSLKNELTREGLKVYYYPDYRVVDVGHDLLERLNNVYSTEARFAILLSSEHYYKEEKIYTKKELEAIQRRIEMEPDMVYLVPVKLDKVIAPEPFDFMNKLVHLEWNNQAEEVARIIKAIVGKELTEATPESGRKNIIYNYGDPMLVIKDSNIQFLNSQIVRNKIVNHGGNVDASTTSIMVNGDLIGFGHKPTKEDEFICPYCFVPLDSKIYGRQVCKNCKSAFIIKPPSQKDVTKYVKITPQEAIQYEKILAHINNNIRAKKYDEALNYCKKAEELAPGEVNTWKNFALTEFLLEISVRDKYRRKNTDVIIKSIRTHIEKCVDHGMTNEEYEEFTLDIANRLFAIEKSRVNSCQPENTDSINGDLWSKNNLAYLRRLLNSYEIAFVLSDNVLFLKEYVAELTKPYKWVIKNAEGIIVNSPACGYFNAAKKISALVEKIKLIDKDYKTPDIAEERFVIRKVAYIKINSIQKN